MNTNKLRKLTPCVLVFSMLGACSQGVPQAQGPSGLPVKIEPVLLATVDDSSDYVANLQSRESVTLQPRVSGQISKILVKAGDRIEAGTPLIQIDPSQQQATVSSRIAGIESSQADLQSAKADLVNARDTLKSLEADRQSALSTLKLNQINWNRNLELVKQGAINKRDFDASTNSLETATANLASTEAKIRAQKASIIKAESEVSKNERLLQQSQANAREQEVALNFYTIVAPFTGTVGDIPVKVGDFVSSSTALLNLTQNDRLELQVSIPVEKATQLHKGLPVQLLGDRNEKKAVGDVFFIAPNVNAQTQSILIKVQFKNPSNTLRADQFTRARVIWSSRPGVLVPTTAISRLGGQNFLFVAESPSLESKPDNNKSDSSKPSEAKAAEIKNEASKQPQLIAKQTPVKLGKIVGNNQEVLEGLKSGDKIVVAGILLLRDGMPIIAATEKAEPTK